MGLTAYESRRPAVDGVVDVGDERNRRFVGERHGCVRDTLFCAAQAQHLVLGIDVDGEAALHEACDGLPKGLSASERWIPVRSRVMKCGGNRVNDRRWGRLIGIP